MKSLDILKQAFREQTIFFCAITSIVYLVPFLIFDAPQVYNIGNSTLNLSINSYLNNCILVLVYLFIPILCSFGFLSFVSKNGNDIYDAPELLHFNILICFLITLAFSLATVCNKFVMVELQYEHIVSLLNKFQIVFAYVLLSGAAETTVYKKKFILVTLGIVNILVFLVSSLMVGYTIAALYFFSFGLLWLIQQKNSARIFTVLLVLTLSFTVISFYEANKGSIRDIFYSGHYLKNPTLNPENENIQQNLRQCSDYINDIEIPRGQVDKHLVGDYRTVNFAENGYSKYSIKETKQAIANIYEVNSLYYAPDIDISISDLAKIERNPLVGLAIARGWGNYIPRDGTRAINLLSTADYDSKVVKYLFSKHFLSGNGIPSNINAGVTCLLETGDSELIQLFINTERGDIRYAIDEIANGFCSIYADCDLKNIILKARNNIKNARINEALSSAKYKPSDLFSAVFKRLDQGRNLALATNEYRLRGGIIPGFDIFQNFLWRFVPRIIINSKPVLYDQIGIEISNYFALNDPIFKNMSWALPLLPEVVLLYGFKGIIFAAISIAVISLLSMYSIYLFPRYYSFLLGVWLMLITETFVNGIVTLLTNAIHYILISFFICLLFNELKKFRSYFHKKKAS